ncbi:MAG: hypothetical protein E6447_14020, partial [Bradyrhizobium sp.]|nr:hypothetical protein [Bradyrhizobium sp.]
AKKPQLRSHAHLATRRDALSMRYEGSCKLLIAAQDTPENSKTHLISMVSLTVRDRSGPRQQGRRLLSAAHSSITTGLR